MDNLSASKSGDAQARFESIDPHASVILQAPAGSGKTSILTQRFLRLLAQAERPEEILAITFTKKAAQEMLDRVLKVIGDSFNRAGLPGSKPAEPGKSDDYQTLNHKLGQAVLWQDQQKGWDIRRNPSRLRIRTIDSFCAYLTGQLSLNSRFGAPLQPTEDEESLNYAAADALLEELGRSDDNAGNVAASLRFLLENLYDNNIARLRDNLAAMLPARFVWLPWAVNVTATLQKFAQQYKERWNAELDKCRKACLVLDQWWRDLGYDDSTLADLKRYVELNYKYCTSGEGKRPLTRAWQHLSDFPSALPPREQAESIIFWHFLGHILKNNAGDNIWSASRGITKAMLPAGSPELAGLKAICSSIADNANSAGCQLFLQLPQYPLDNGDGTDTLRHILLVLKRLAGYQRVIFQEQATCDFSQIAIGSLQALQNDCENLAEKLDAQIKHILVDEYQDTSLLQAQLLKDLTWGWTAERTDRVWDASNPEKEGRTFFAVGDPMQSIYRFRQAEVSVFLETSANGLGDIKPKLLKLTRNFRSDPELITKFNSCFSNIFQKENNAYSGAISYCQAEAGRIPSADRDQQAAPERWVIINLKSGNTQAQEAQKISSLIDEEKIRDPDCDIAILVRTRKDVAAIVPMLRDKALLAPEIGYQATEMFKLKNSAPVPDLWALTRAILNPADTVAWLACLRAPWCGLTLTELQGLLPSAESPSKYLIMPELIARALDDNAGPASATWKTRLRRCFQALQESYGLRHSLSLRQAVESCWLALGGPALLHNDRASLQNSEDYFRILDSFGMSWPQLEEISNKLEKLYARSVPSAHPVQVLTIHKAKGLEYDVVIIPSLQSVGQRYAQQLLNWKPLPDAPASEENYVLAPLAPAQRSEMPPAGSHFLSPVDGAALCVNQFFLNEVKDYEQTAEANELVRLFYVAGTRAQKKLYTISTLTKEQENAQKKEAKTGKSFIGDLPLPADNASDRKFSDILMRWPEAKAQPAVDLPKPNSAPEPILASFAAPSPDAATNRDECATPPLNRLPAGYVLPELDSDKGIFLRRISGHAPASNARTADNLQDDPDSEPLSVGSDELLPAEDPASDAGENGKGGHLCRNLETARLSSLRGNMVHNLLRVVCEQGLSKWTEGRPSRLQSLLNSDFLPRKLLEMGYTMETQALERARQDIAQSLRCLEQGPIMREQIMRSWSRESQCELPLYAVLQDEHRQDQHYLYSRVIDRTYIDDEGVRWIVDYKTNKDVLSGASALKTAAGYRQQMETYARIMQIYDSTRRTGATSWRLRLYFTHSGYVVTWSAGGNDMEITLD